MSVTDSFTLPGQPAAGDVSLIPLGGDGWTAPHSMFLVNATLAQDASGGTAAIRVLRDRRWEHLVGIVAVFDNDVTGKNFQFDITAQDVAGPFFIVGGDLDVLPGLTQSKLWAPPPIFDAQSVQGVVDNVDTFTLTLTATIYNFRVDASKRTPLSILLASLPSAGGLQ